VADGIGREDAAVRADDAVAIGAGGGFRPSARSVITTRPSRYCRRKIDARNALV
jgi:hypothetical protein